MPSEIRVNVPEFWDQGYLLIRDVFSTAEVEDFRRHVLENRQWKGKCDLLSHPHLRKALLDDRVLSIAAQILGDTPVYYGDSNFTIGQQSFDFHKDNADRGDSNAPDWMGAYTQIRFGLYLQEHARHSGGLRVIAGSHNSVSNPSGKRVNLRTRVGDLIVWNLRTDHTGAATLLRLLPWVCAEQRQTSRWNSRYLVRLNRPFPMIVP
ncbi:MAG TPA: phytanoyl-CoA dioxygenase family protein, partial [Myxococcota bacterium]|nr:phytanoyl-CoA dioxygenase family protein [Myxococcota bacterium]